MRGKKIGKALIYEIENIGRERNCYYTIFVSGIQRKDAHRFYESIGYSLDSVQGFKKYLLNNRIYKLVYCWKDIIYIIK